MDGLSGKHFRLCNSVSFVAVLVKGLQSQFGCARLVILCGFGSFSVIVFCFVFLFMYFSFSSELLFDSIGYGSLPACLPAWLFPLPACLHDCFHCLPACTWPFCLLPHMAATIGIHALLSFPGPPCVLAPWPTAGSIVPPVSAGKSLTPSRPGSQLKNSVRGTPVVGDAEHEELPPREPTPVPSMSIYMQAVEWLLEVKAIPVSVVPSC